MTATDGVGGLYGDVDMTRVLYGQNARQVPAWLYVQDQGDGMVSFIGSSRVEGSGDTHPLRLGSQRTHQFVLGEIIVRPTRLVVATDAYIGHGLGSLATNDHDLREMLADGEVLWEQTPGLVEATARALKRR